MTNHSQANPYNSFPNPELLKVFETVPDLYLILSPDLSILNASNAFLAATHRRREEIIGKLVSKVFPDNPAEQAGNSAITLEHSFRQAVSSGLPHRLDLIRYDLYLPDEHGGSYQTRFWQGVNTPVMNEHGIVQYVIHKVTTVTDQGGELLEVSKQRVQLAQAEADRQRQLLHNTLMQAPALICIFEGPNHVFKLVNPPYQQLVGERPLIGKPIREAMPELAGQPIFDLLDQVYTSGESFYAYETLVQLDHDNSGRLGENFYNFIYRAIRDLHGQIEGILVFAYEVTPQVQARVQTQTLNEELKASNLALSGAKQALEMLNGELEARVKKRTRELELAQTETQRQKARLERLFMQAPAAICILDGPDLVFELVNPKYQQLFPGRQLLGLPIADAIPEISEHRALDTFKAVYETGQTHEERGILIPLSRPEDGVLHNRYFNYIQQARFDEQGRVDGVLVFAFEVTEQVISRQKAEESARRFHLLSESIPQIIWTATADGNLDYFSRQWYDYSGYDYEQSKGAGWASAIHPDDLPGLFVEWTQSLQTGEPYEVEARVRRADHVYRWLLIRALPLRNEQGEIAQWMGTCTDLEDQKQTEQQLMEREQYFRLIADNVPAMIWITRPDGYCTYINKRWMEYTGQTLEEAQGLGWTRATHPDDAEMASRTFMEASDNQTLFRLTFRLRGKDGEYRWYTDVGTPRFSPDGTFEGHVGAVLDIHDQKITEEALHRLSVELVAANLDLAAASKEIQANNEELAESNRQLTLINADLDNFIYTASHDLKAPISNIESLLWALLRNLSPESLASERIQRITSLMQESVDRFKRTIGSLTEVVKLQKENNAETVSLDLLRVIDEVRLDLEPIISASKAQLEIDVVECPTIRFSEKNLRSVVYNLLSNAIKYRSPHRVPHVRIYSARTADFCVLTVTDNGLGLEPDRITQLFTMFKRLHDHVEGAGIGLYMVKKMVENAGGKIEVSSQIDQGTSFSVYFRH